MIVNGRALLQVIRMLFGLGGLQWDKRKPFKGEAGCMIDRPSRDCSHKVARQFQRAGYLQILSRRSCVATRWACFDFELSEFGEQQSDVFGMSIWPPLRVARAPD